MEVKSNIPGLEAAPEETSKLEVKIGWSIGHPSREICEQLVDLMLDYGCTLEHSGLFTKAAIRSEITNKMSFFASNIAMEAIRKGKFDREGDIW